MTAQQTPAPRSPEEVLLRPARQDDVPAIVALVQAAYRGEGGWTTEAHLVDGARTDEGEVAAMLVDDTVTLLVAELDGTVRGCCYTHREPVSADGTTRAELGLFAVHPAAQSRGLGARLLEAQAAHLGGIGVDVLMIRVLQSRPELHAWYERHGFAPTGQRVPFAGSAEALKVAELGMDVMERPLTAAP
ncbi:GNAT family N-acetyltransferase [Brachybacterium sp. YJGR34]|uniref:GNAT family N-acetyltransferase n=1 Tax=Brachybacterium sp. YJGR34 TaxID=2059911 RepID=UPI000E0C7575|nr:GNAT family N-acetyltransferase [Brachybacterium sp. YJGR34]